MNITLYGIASAIAFDLKKSPKSLDELRHKYNYSDRSFLFEKAIDLLVSLSQINLHKDGKLYAKRRKVSTKEILFAALG